MRRLALVSLMLLVAACSSVDATPPQAHTTAVPGDFTCPAPDSEATPGDDTVRQGVIAVRLCPHNEVLAYDHPPEPNMVAPIDALTTRPEKLVESINAQPLVDNRGVQMCPGVGGLNFLLVLQYADGSLRTLEGSLGGCSVVDLGGDHVRENASAILDTYDDLLRQQRRASTPPEVIVDLACPADRDTGYVTQTPVADPAEVTHALVCTRDKYRLPFHAPQLMDEAEVRRLARDLAGHSSSSDYPPVGLRNCPESLTTVVVGQTGWGDVFQLEDLCDYLMHGGRVWQQSEQTTATIDRLVTDALRP